jgi:hypothetical protein
LTAVSWGQSCNAPVAAASPVPAGAFQQIVAHITTGGGFVTKLTIVNLGASSNSIVLNNIHQDGTPIDSTSCTIPANGTLRLSQGSVSNPNETHWAIVGSSAPVGVNLFFEFTNNGAVSNTVGFNDVAPRTSFTLPVELQSNPFHTLGLAVANPGSTSNTITVTLQDRAGATVGTKSVNLPPFGQVAADFLASTSPFSFSSVVGSSNFIGAAVVTSSAPAAIVGVGDDLGPFFSEAPMFVAAPSSGGSSITASVALTSADSINAGTCIQKSATATGATTSMAVAISPQGDPIAGGLSKVIWNAWVDAPGHVTAQFCKFATGFATPSGTITFNIRVLGSSSAGTGTLSVASGTQVAGGACTLRGGAVAGATTSDVVVLTPPSDPANVGLSEVQFQGFVDSPGHVTAELCKFGAGTLTSTAALNFNVVLLN